MGSFHNGSQVLTFVEKLKVGVASVEHVGDMVCSHGCTSLATVVLGTIRPQTRLLNVVTSRKVCGLSKSWHSLLSQREEMNSRYRPLPHGRNCELGPRLREPDAGQQLRNGGVLLSE